MKTMKIMKIMTMKTIESLLLIAALSVGCGADPETGPEITPIGPPAYELIEVWVGLTSTLYHDDLETFQLVRSDNLEVLAVLAPESRDMLAEAIADVVSGETAIGSLDPQCLSFHDRNLVTLTLSRDPSSLAFEYPDGCAPAGLATLDAILGEVMLAMETCAPSPHLESCTPITAP